MEFREKIKYIIAALLLFPIVFGGLIYFFFREYTDSLRQSSVANEMVVVSLNGRLYADDYLLYSGERAKAQWRAGQDLVLKLAESNVHLDTPEEKELIRKIRNSLISAGATFDQLVMLVNDTPDASLRRERESQLMEELTLKIQETSLFSSQLAEFNDSEAVLFLKYIFILFSCMAFLFFILLVGSFRIIWRGVYQLDSVKTKAQKERDRLDILLQSIGDGVVAIDRHWNITLWNNAADQLTGWKREEVMGKLLREFLKFVREYDRKENIAFIEEAMLFGKSHQMENNTLLIRKDGSEVYVGDSAAPVFDQQGQVDGAIIIFRDISQERALEKAREEFASLANHQLRTPPTVIRGYLSMLLDESAEPLTKTQKENLKAVEQANERMLTLVNAMLNASRIETGALEINPEPAYLPDLVEKALNEFMPQIADKKLKLQKKFESNLPSISVDPKLMNAVWQNLISNAIKYTPEGGSIDVEIAKKDQDILLRVADTGMGIPKEQQSKMFIKMFRADNARAKDPDGAGLGLYIVKYIIETAGGKIWFESEENNGTSFFITLPLSGMKKREGTKGLQ